MAGMIGFGWPEWLFVSGLRWLHVVDVPIVYLLGPLLYGYVIALTSTASPIHAKSAVWHGLPFAAATQSDATKAH